MPYGFIETIEQKGYSAETINSYEKVIQQFFSFIGSTYPQNKEPFQISPSDIKQYLKEQQEKQKSISTINKELAIIKTLFNYLWEIDKVPVDPTVKIRRIKLQERINLEITYQEILELQIKVLNNPSYSPLRKVIFLLATKGLKTADFRFTKQHVSISSTRNQVEIDLSNRMITLEGVEATLFKEYYYESLTNNNHYVFITKHRAKEDPGPIQVMSILTHLRAISKDFLSEHVPALTLISIRKALIYDLYKRRISIQMIANTLGIEEISASNYLKSITDGILRKKTNTV